MSMLFNKQKKSAKAISALFFGSLLAWSCTSEFEEMNRPNFNPLIVEAETDTTGNDTIIIVGDPGDYIYDFTYNGVIDNHQRTTNLYHDLYAHYFADNKFEITSHYLYEDAWMKFRWEQFYTNRHQNFKSINKVCRQDTNKYFRNAYHITWINYYFLLSLMTDTYGPIPCTSVLDNMEYELKKNLAANDFNVYYDTQDKIYYRMLQQLAAHQDSLNLDGSKEIYAFDERENIFQGDVLKWKKFANSLRLRLALRISNIDPARAQAEAEAAIADGVMESNSDTYAVNYAWPNSHENDYSLVGYLWGDVVMSKDIENMYKKQSTKLDPRCERSWYRNLSPHSDILKGIEAPFGDYVGNMNGATNLQHTAETGFSFLKSKGGTADDFYWFDYNRPFECLNYSEVCFMLAEASLRGYAGAGKTAEQYYLDGIRASMGYYNIPSAEIESYIAGLKNNPFASGDNEAILEQIINQKWLANFPNGAEGWADFRRTDYPALSDIVENRSSDVPQGKFIKRINYPVSEHDLNESNVYYPYGTDDKGIKLWWDTDDTNASANTRNKPNNFR